MAKVKANQLEINKNLDLVHQFEKNMDLLLQILTKNEEKKDEQGASSTSDDFLNPPSVYHTPPQSSVGPLIVYRSLPSVHKVPASEMENVSFKRRKLVNVKLKEFTNQSGKQFKVNDPCDIDLVCPYNKDQFKKTQ